MDGANGADVTVGTEAAGGGCGGNDGGVGATCTCAVTCTEGVCGVAGPFSALVGVTAGGLDGLSCNAYPFKRTKCRESLT